MGENARWTIKKKQNLSVCFLRTKFSSTISFQVKFSVHCNTDGSPQVITARLGDMEGCVHQT